MSNVEEFEKKIRKGRSPQLSETTGDKLRKVFGKKKKTFESPMKMERKKEGYRSKAEKMGSKVKFADEMDAMTKGLDTLTSKGPGKLKVGSFATGGRAGYKMGGKCKIAKKGKGRAYGKNS